MKYSKPEIVAQNSQQGIYAAGCPRDCSGTNIGARCFLPCSVGR